MLATYKSAEPRRPSRAALVSPVLQSPPATHFGQAPCANCVTRQNGGTMGKPGRKKKIKQSKMQCQGNKSHTNPPPPANHLNPSSPPRNPGENHEKRPGGGEGGHGQPPAAQGLGAPTGGEPQDPQDKEKARPVFLVCRFIAPTIFFRSGGCMAHTQGKSRIGKTGGIFVGLSGHK